MCSVFLLGPGTFLDRWPAINVADWATPEDSARLIVDATGIEWEVYDESRWSIELALDWEFLPQTNSPGLIFSSNTDRRRLWPCPDEWKRLSDGQLLDLLTKARSMY
jgi:hypothetical protein